MQTVFSTPNWNGDVNRKLFNLQKQSLMLSLEEFNITLHLHCKHGPSECLS